MMRCWRGSEASPWCDLTYSLATAEYSLWAEQENDDEDEQCARVLEVGRDPEAGHLDQQADDQGADQRTERRSEATERDGGEHQQQHLGAHVPLDARPVVGVQDAG